MTFQDVVSFLTRGMGMEENGQGWGHDGQMFGTSIARGTVISGN